MSLVQIFARLSDSAWKRAESMLRSNSGSDQAESEIYVTESRVYQDLCRGRSIEESLTRRGQEFRQYVAENNQRVANAPKIRNGPRAGQSWIDHRWVDPEAFERRKNEIRMAISREIKKEIEKMIQPPPPLREDAEEVLRQLQASRRQNDSFGVGTYDGQEQDGALVQILEDLLSEGLVIRERIPDGWWWRTLL